MAARPVQSLALCAGAGGLELGVSLALDHLGIGYRLVGAVEREAFAAACLVARMEDEALDQAPVWDDLCTFDPAPWRGRVDLVSAGFPCQPFSHAGQRGGSGDDRWLWPEIARVVGVVGPRLVFLENSDALTSERFRAEFGDLLGDLASLGFDAEWELLAASNIGAPHRRKRLWLLAHRDLGRLTELGCERLPDDRVASRGHDLDRPSRASLADTDGERRSAHVGDDDPRQSDAARDDAPGWPEPDGGRIFPPCPDDHDGWREWIEAGGPEPSVRRDADGLASRLDRLHAIGNGVVPLVAATAFVRLARCAGLVSAGR